MNKENYKYFEKIVSCIEILSCSSEFDNHINNLANLILETSNNNKITAIYGNGGSASDSQHFSAELVGKFKKNGRRPFKAISLNTDTSFITAWSNDFDYSSIFERQIEAFSSSLGLSIGLSTSGKSESVLNALKLSNSLNIQTFLITGKNCPNYEFINHIVKLPSDETSIIQTLTQVMYHLVCLKLEAH
tara:strand:- start:1651 stop:2217 length:567 start_codon:yes stop_codon:yes gene_type:complete